MRHTHSIRRLVAAAVIGVLAATLAGGAAYASPDGPGVHPAGATIGEYDHVIAPAVVTGALSRKMAIAAQIGTSSRPASGRVSPNQIPCECSGVPASKTLAVQYQIQQHSNWCGPTTLAVILQYKGIGFSGTQTQQQQAAANLLGTTADGTAWYGSDNVPSYPGTSWYPMQDALNYELYKHGISTSQFQYLVHSVTAGNATDVSDFANVLRTDIGYYGYPFAMNEYAAPGYQVGRQPGNQWIMHWMVANGYTDNGSKVVFEDPQWGNGSASTDLASKMITAIAGRGYIW